MKHLKKGRKFGRERGVRRALMKSLASSFFMLGRMETTEAKAKELQPYVEKFLTRAKNPTFVNRKFLRRFFSEKVTAKITEEAKNFSTRSGGYTRITKLAPRKIDGAKRAILELIPNSNL